MSRNNNDRLGGATPPDDTPTATVADPTTTTTANETQAPTLGQGSVGLNFVVPTEFVDLPFMLPVTRFMDKIPLKSVI